jgi:hypothetical protein
VVTLIQYGWPPSLLVMYDEAWAVVQQASGLMADATGGNRVNMDILAWCEPACVSTSCYTLHCMVEQVVVGLSPA